MREEEKYLFDLNVEWMTTLVESTIIIIKKLYLFKEEKE